MQTELQRLQAELAEMQRAMQRMQSEGQHAPGNQLVLAQRAYAQASHMRSVPHLPWQVSSQQLSLQGIYMQATPTDAFKRRSLMSWTVHF